MAEYYTREEIIEMTQSYLGTKVGTDNKRFPPDACMDAWMRQVHGWQPWLPADMQDSFTERPFFPVFALDAIAQDYVINLDSTCARVISIDMPGLTDQHIEIYGLDRGMGVGDHNAYVDRCQRLRRTNMGIRLFCKVGKRILTYPRLTPSTFPYVEVIARVYVDEPTVTVPLRIPKIAVPFHLSGAAVGGKWGDLRESAANAMLSEFNSNLKTVFSIKEAEKQRA